LFAPSKAAPDFKQQALKAAPGPAWTDVVAAQLLDQLVVAVDNTAASTDATLRGEAAAPPAG
jgi:hypothetical protein